jgi:hypothetical protein
MRDSAAVIAATMFVVLSGSATAESSKPMPLATVDYAATLMDSSHVQVENNLMSLLRKRNLQRAPASLLSGGYQGLVRLLAGKQGAAFDRETLPKIDDHMHRVEALLVAESGTAGVR